MDPGRPATEWQLDSAYFDDVWAFRDRLPAGAAWYSSPEPKAGSFLAGGSGSGELATSWFRPR